MANPPPPTPQISTPQTPSAFTLNTIRAAQDILSAPPSVATLNRALRYLAKWRAEILANTVLRREAGIVVAGPFAGMVYRFAASEGSRVARLLGAYEASLHPIIEQIIASAPDVIVDIGSAEGYYAVGFARRLPTTRILARDASDIAQTLCRALAAANGVETQVEVGGLFGGADFDLCQTARTVVICDIEGAEGALLDPVAAPGLAFADILVECHPGTDPGVTDRLAARFAASHRITKIGRKLDDSGLPDWMDAYSDLDRLISLWEWRTAPTPWLWMEKL